MSKEGPGTKTESNCFLWGTNRLIKEELLIGTYRASGKDARQIFDHLLSKHAHLAGGHNAYAQKKQNNAIDRMTCLYQISAFSWNLAEARERGQMQSEPWKFHMS